MARMMQKLARDARGHRGKAIAAAHTAEIERAVDRVKRGGVACRRRATARPRRRSVTQARRWHYRDHRFWNEPSGR